MWFTGGINLYNVVYLTLLTGWSLYNDCTLLPECSLTRCKNIITSSSLFLQLLCKLFLLVVFTHNCKFNISDVIDIMMDSDGDSDDDTRMREDEINNDIQINSDNGGDGDDEDDGGDGDGDDNSNVDEEQNHLRTGHLAALLIWLIIDFFELLVTDDILDLIVDQTNLQQRT